jgi:hypothetical protein
MLARGPQQPRLAEARGPLDQQRAATAALRRSDRRFDRLQLRDALQERRAVLPP